MMDVAAEAVPHIPSMFLQKAATTGPSLNSSHSAKSGIHADVLEIGCHDEAWFSVLQVVSALERTHLCAPWCSQAQGQSWVSYMRETHAMNCRAHAQAGMLTKACQA